MKYYLIAIAWLCAWRTAGADEPTGKQPALPAHIVWGEPCESGLQLGLYQPDKKRPLLNGLIRNAGKEPASYSVIPIGHIKLEVRQAGAPEWQSMGMSWNTWASIGAGFILPVIILQPGETTTTPIVPLFPPVPAKPPTNPATFGFLLYNFPQLSKYQGIIELRVTQEFTTKTPGGKHLKLVSAPLRCYCSYTPAKETNPNPTNLQMSKIVLSTHTALAAVPRGDSIAQLASHFGDYFSYPLTEKQFKAILNSARPLFDAELNEQANPPRDADTLCPVANGKINSGIRTNGDLYRGTFATHEGTYRFALGYDSGYLKPPQGAPGYFAFDRGIFKDTMCSPRDQCKTPNWEGDWKEIKSAGIGPQAESRQPLPAQQPLLVTLNISPADKDGRIDWRNRDTHAIITIANITATPLTIWSYSWGHGLYNQWIEVTEVDGKPVHNSLLHLTHAMPMPGSDGGPKPEQLAPGEQLTRFLYPADHEKILYYLDLKSSLVPGAREHTVTMRAVFCIYQDRFTTAQGVWTGRIESEPKTFRIAQEQVDDDMWWRPRD